nr:PREDICTED: monocarboxylate transporter 13-like [Latimeria chalumnae]|eukprot:XP_014349175.1 PREDICTED: monocarboxylate transporter 13-like [Latimeria chalumnae]
MQWTENEPPDGGYSWIVVASTFVIMGLTAAVLKSFGLFFVDVQQHFNELASSTSWITSISIVMLHLGAPIASALSVRFTHRAVIIVGGLLAFSGMVLGSLGLSMIWMYATAGFLQGLGIAFAWTPGMSTVSQYFSKRRPFATAITSAGECIFAFAFSPFFQWLINTYEWRGAMLIIGGILLNIYVCGALMRPSKKPLCVKSESIEFEKHIKSDSVKNSRDDIPTFQSQPKKIFDWTFFKRVDFLLYAIFGLLAAAAFFIPPLFLVPYASTFRTDEYQTAVLLSVLASTDLIGRLTCGWFANLHLTRTILLLVITVTLLGISLLLLPTVGTYTYLAIFTGLYGFFFGATIAIHITVLTDVAGMTNFDSALGLFMLIRSVGGFVGPPVAGKFCKQTFFKAHIFYVPGLLVDLVHDYSIGFYLSGTTLCLSVVFLIMVDYHLQKKKMKLIKKLKISEQKNPSLETSDKEVLEITQKTCDDENCRV